MLKANNLAPVILFAFSRPQHTRKTLCALASNYLASETDLIVYTDSARNESEKSAVNETRNLIRATQGFRSMTVVERQTNYGLARNIIEGVTETCNRYGRAIVLEDDMITSPHFLTFMNNALDYYKDERSVWHISGWNYPIDPSGLEDAFFVRVMSCWGWATWANRWQYYEKNTKNLINEFDHEMITNFDLNGSGAFWSQVENNHRGKLNTWAIFWYATIFKNDGLCLNPSVSYVENIGFDESGTHGKISDAVYSNATLNSNAITKFPTTVTENQIGIKRITDYYKRIKPSIFRIILNKLRHEFHRWGYSK